MFIHKVVFSQVVGYLRPWKKCIHRAWCLLRLLTVLDPSKSVDAYSQEVVFTQVVAQVSLPHCSAGHHTPPGLFSPLHGRAQNKHTHQLTHSLHKASESIQVLAVTSVARELQAPPLNALLSPCWQNPSTGSPWLGDESPMQPPEGQIWGKAA